VTIASHGAAAQVVLEVHVIVRKSHIRSAGSGSTDVDAVEDPVEEPTTSETPPTRGL
jgi:hypothetical protein